MTGPSASYMPSLDSLRGVAALLVAAMHLSWFFSATLDLHFGFLAVELFFVISGVVIARSYEAALVESKDIGRFFIRRMARLYPLHLLTLLMMLGLDVLFAGILKTGHIVYTDQALYTFSLNLLMLQCVGLWKGDQIWNFPSWSISVELAVNLIWALLLVRGLYSISMRWLIVYGCALVLVTQKGLSLYGGFYENSFGVLNNGILRGMAGFTLGTLVWHYREYLGAWTRENPGLRAAAELALIGSFVGLASLYGSALYLGMDYVFMLVLFPLAVAFTMIPGTYWQKTLDLAPLRFLGQLSYSVYLLHMPVSVVFGVVWVFGLGLREPSSIKGLSYLAVLIMTSAVVYHWFELPARRWIVQRFDKRPEPELKSAQSAAQPAGLERNAVPAT